MNGNFPSSLLVYGCIVMQGWCSILTGAFRKLIIMNPANPKEKHRLARLRMMMCSLRSKKKKSNVHIRLAKQNPEKLHIGDLGIEKAVKQCFTAMNIDFRTLVISFMTNKSLFLTMMTTK
jgi:hypothetical protein